jgi:hypothetical protein
MTTSGILQRLRRAVTSLLGDRGGNAAIELAFTAPGVLMFILGICEAGRMLWLQNALNYSVAEAARCWSNNTTTCGSATQAASYAATASGAGFSSSVFTGSTPSCGKQVSASYPMTLAMPYMNLSLTLTSQACYPT